MIKNITGKTFPIIAIFSKSLSKDLNPLLSYNFVTCDNFSKFFKSFLEFDNFVFASSIFLS